MPILHTFTLMDDCSYYSFIHDFHIFNVEIRLFYAILTNIKDKIMISILVSMLLYILVVCNFKHLSSLLLNHSKLPYPLAYYFALNFVMVYSVVTSLLAIVHMLHT